MKIFVTSDTHIGHRNILNFQNHDGKKIRPFLNIEEMNNFLLDKWNSVISDDDIVYHLGDIGFHRNDTERFLQNAKGRKHLILGNHDTFRMSFYEGYFNSIKVMKRFTLSSGEKLLLSHYPIHDFSLYNIDINVHGHIHEKDIDDIRYKNVSVERTDWTPIEIERVLEL